MKFLKDITLNIVSQAMFIAVQQLLLFPVFEKHLGQSNFGWFLLIYGFLIYLQLHLLQVLLTYIKKNSMNYSMN